MSVQIWMSRDTLISTNLPIKLRPLIKGMALICHDQIEKWMTLTSSSSLSSIPNARITSDLLTWNAQLTYDGSG